MRAKKIFISITGISNMIEFYIFGDMGSGLKPQYDVSNALLEDGIKRKTIRFSFGF